MRLKIFPPCALPATILFPCRRLATFCYVFYDSPFAGWIPAGGSTFSSNFILRRRGAYTKSIYHARAKTFALFEQKKKKQNTVCFARGTDRRAAPYHAVGGAPSGGRNTHDRMQIRRQFACRRGTRARLRAAIARGQRGAAWRWSRRRESALRAMKRSPTFCCAPPGETPGRLIRRWSALPPWPRDWAWTWRANCGAAAGGAHPGRGLRSQPRGIPLRAAGEHLGWEFVDAAEVICLRAGAR